MPSKDAFKALRQQAEQRLSRENAEADEPVAADLQALLQELRVQKIELEMQNESLRESQKSLALARNGFARLFDEAPSGYVVLDENGVIAQANLTFASMLGLAIDALQFKPFSTCVAPEGRAIFNSRFRAFFRNPAGKFMELPLLGPGGSPFCRLQGRCERLDVFDAANEESGARRLLVTLVDITDRKRAEERLAQSEAHFQALFDSVQDAVALKESSFRRLKSNPAMAALAGLTPETLTGRDDFEIFPRATAQSMRQDDERAFRGESVRAEYRITVGDRERMIEALKHPVRDGAGNVIGLCESLRDVTARKEQERSLREALEAAETASRSKSEFIANMSHEIRTPLNGVLGMLQLMDTTSCDPEQREYLDIAAKSARALLRLLTDVLDLASLDANRLEIRSAPFDLADVLEATTAAFETAARDKGLEFVIEMDRTLPRRLRGDAARLRQILLNLVGNAVKFTSSGWARLDVFRLSEKRLEQTIRIAFVVRDAGPGIPEDKLALVLECFSQADGSMTRRHGGAGLGLCLVKRLVELMGGVLRLRSEPGEGLEARVELEFPVETENAPPKESPCGY